MIEHKDTQNRYKLPDKVIYCRECTISNQRPRITFDKNGVCSACNYAKIKKTKIDWLKRDKELQELCDKHRKNDGSYDVIVPSSGGKDSAYVAYPLTVTWSPYLWTKDGFDNVLGTPKGDWRVDHKEHYFSGLAPEDLTEYGISSKDILQYMVPKTEELGLDIYFFGYYKQWVSQELYYHAVEHTGFKPKYASFDGEFPMEHFKVFLDYCNITEKYFYKLIDSWRSPHLWTIKNNKWILKFPI
jgi:hypothetical protein